MSEALPLRVLTNPAPHIEKALLSRPNLVEKVAQGDMFARLRTDSPAAASALCQTVCLHVVQEIPMGDNIAAERQALLRGMDGAWHVANASKIVGIPRFAASPEDAVLSDRDATENLVNNALAYMCGHSAIASDLYVAARPHLDRRNINPLETYIGFAVGLLMTSYGEIEKNREDRLVQARLRDEIARAAIAPNVRSASNGGPVFLG